MRRGLDLTRLPPRLLLAGTLIAAFGYGVHATREGTLSIGIVDAATGQKVPVRVRLQDANGVAPRVSGALTVSETAIPIPKQAIAVMWGQQDRAQGYALQPDGSFYVDGAFDAAVPPGTYTLTVSKGFEYLRQSIRLDAAAGAGLTREVRLDRWIDMPARGWYSADDHIHLRRSPADDAAIVRWIAAEDVHVGNVLQMGDFWETYFSQYAFGPKGRYQENGRWLSPGQEDPRTPEIGHTISLGADQFVRVRSDYYSYDRLFDRIHELSGVTGFAHQGMSFHGYRGMVLNTLRGKNDFLELAQFCVPQGPLALDHYYLFLDLGIRLTALAGSDFPWCGRGPAYGLPGPPVAQIGNARFYTYVGGPLSFESWFAALKAGRTFVTPRVEVRSRKELGELGNNSVCLHLARVSRNHAEPLLDPPTLRLVRELGGVAVRQRRLDHVEARRAGPVLGQVEQLRDFVPQRHDPRLSDGELTSGMGRTAHLQEQIDPFA